MNGNIYNRINTSLRFVSFLVAVCLPPKMSQKRILYTGCIFHTNILDRVVFLCSEKFQTGLDLSTKSARTRIKMTEVPLPPGSPAKLYFKFLLRFVAIILYNAHAVHWGWCYVFGGVHCIGEVGEKVGGIS